jgi:MFS family permease
VPGLQAHPGRALALEGRRSGVLTGPEGSDPGPDGVAPHRADHGYDGADLRPVVATGSPLHEVDPELLPTADDESSASDGLMAPAYRAFTVGVVAVMTMFAFEGIGVASAMPTVARALDGLGSYAWAFNGYIVTGLVAMVLAGEWCDRTGPRGPLLLGVSLFGLGAFVAGASWTMTVLVLARAVQGFGMGLAIVSVYVVIGRAFPDRLRPRAFAVLSAAWVLPAIVGPLVAGFLTDHVSWRAVFWLVVPFVIPPMILLVPRVAGFGGSAGDGPPRRGRIRIAIVAATGLALLQQAGTVRGPAGAGLVVVGVALLLPSLRHLLPAGALRFARGLPTVVTMRGLLAGAFFAGEAFVPLALQTIRGVSTAQAGGVLTVGAIGWALGSQVQGRLYGRLPRHRLVQIGAALVAICLATVAVSLVPSVPYWVAVLSWIVGAAGMGMCFGAIGTLVLELSEPEDQGANVAALQVCDSVGSVVFVGIAGAIYAAALAAGSVSAATFTTIWLTMAAVAAAGSVVAGRIARPLPAP